MNPMLQKPPAAAPPQQPAAPQMSPQLIAQHADTAAYSAQAFGSLVRKPDLTDKDVIGAIGKAVADGKITAANAVKFLSGMPQDEAQLKPWMDQLYHKAITNAVQLRAMMMGGQPPAPAPPQAAPATPQQPNPMMGA